jgi:hypothetical protein
MNRVNRRQFMARTAALNVALMAVPPAFAAPWQTSCGPRLGRVVADARFAPSVAFAAAMAANGTPTSTTDGDLTSLWFDDLARHFAQSSAAIAGLTTARTALVMIELARGPGVRVLWRGEHMAMPDGSLQHELEGAAAIVARAAELTGTSEWSASLASVLSEAAYSQGLQKRRVRAIVHAPRAVGLIEETLSSWVLVPRRTARA